MKIIRNIDVLHPILKKCTEKIQNEVINAHNIPIKLFETGRDHDRQEFLLLKGKTQNAFSKHIFNMDHNPPLYATAVDYVYFDDKWSWNLRDSTVASWYLLFGNLVVDTCPELYWFGQNRKGLNYCHFEVREDIIISNLSKYPCVIY